MMNLDIDLFLWFDTEEQAIEAEAAISAEMGLPSEKGERWDIPELREFSEGIEKWSIVKPLEGLELLTNTMGNATSQ